MKRTTYLYSLLIWITYLAVVAIDLAAVKFPALGKIGTSLWFFSYIFLFIFAAKSLISILANIRSADSPAADNLSNNTRLATIRSRIPVGLITPLMLAIWFYVVFQNIPLEKSVSYEATQQTNRTLSALSTPPDFAFRQSVFLGYPARQFFLPALPSILLGRSVFALNLGGSLYFLLGLLIFSSGVLASFANRRQGDLICGILLAAMFHIYWLNYQLFYFEQSVYPFSLALILCGLFLHAVKSPSLEILGLIAWLILYLIFSYTPSLALVLLTVLSLITASIRIPTMRPHRVPLLVIAAISLLSIFLSLPIRQDVRLAGAKAPFTGPSVSSRLTDMTEHLLFQTKGRPVVSPILNFAVIALLFSSLLLVNSWEMLLLSFWVLATFAAGVLTRGWFQPEVEFALHRGMVAFPVLFLMAVWIIHRKNWAAHLRSCTILFLLLFLTGLYYQQVFLRSNGLDPRVNHVQFANWLRNTANPSQPTTLYFTTSLIDRYCYWNLNDIMEYLVPNAKSQPLPIRAGFLFTPRAHQFLCTTKKDRQSIPYSSLTPRMDYVGTFTFKQDTPVELWKLR